MALGVYSVLKHVHVSTAVISFFLFFLRGCWMLADSPRLRRRWVRIVPHLNDTLLLASAVTMTVLIHQYPFMDAWLTAKMLALLAYIGLGTVALKRGRTKTIRIAAWIAALAVFGYIVSVALNHDPRGLLAT